MKWELFNETKEVTFNPVQMMKIDGVDEAIQYLESYCRTAKIDEVDGRLFVKPRLKESMETIFLCAKLLDFDCAKNRNTFYNRLVNECPSLIQIEAVSQILMMKVSDFCFSSDTYKPIFELIGDQIVSFSNAENILRGAGEKIIPPKAPEPEKGKPKSKFPGKRKKMHRDRSESYDD